MEAPFLVHLSTVDCFTTAHGPTISVRFTCSKKHVAVTQIRKWVAGLSGWVILPRRVFDQCLKAFDAVFYPLRLDIGSFYKNELIRGL